MWSGQNQPFCSGLNVLNNLAICSLSGMTFYHQLYDWRCSIECYNGHIALPPRGLSNFRAIGKVETLISRIWNFTRSRGKTSVCLANSGSVCSCIRWLRHAQGALCNLPKHMHWISLDIRKATYTSVTQYRIIAFHTINNASKSIFYCHGSNKILLNISMELN